jgi:hypothetical protein
MTLLLAVSNIGLSFIDMVVEGMMVMQAKKKPTVGAQDLESFRHIS